MGLVNETVYALNSEYNLGKDTAKSMMPYCRPAVEKYVFGKLYDQLFAMYRVKNESDDNKYLLRKSRIQAKMNPQEIMIYLGINKKFILGLSPPP